MAFSHNIPQGVMGCHYVEQHELRRGLESHSKFCEYYDPGNYFFVTSRPDSVTIEGWLGRHDYHPTFFEQAYTSLTFFQDYQNRKVVCFTFDRTTLYRLVTILPEKPLKFILQQVQDLSKLYSMINQEEIYQLIQKKQWAAILDILYKNKKCIADDALLLQSAQIFESEFQKTIEGHPLNDKEFTALMEKLYMLHGGKFYTLQPATHKLLTIQLAKRKEGKEAFNYAREYPQDPEAQIIIDKYRSSNDPWFQCNPKILAQQEWIEIYNRLFELINEKDNSETYFSGQRFITAVQEFVPYFPDYSQYINLRNQQGKSTSRKIYYYDILMQQHEDVRTKIIKRIISQVTRQYPEKVKAIEMLLGLQSREENLIKKTETEEVPEGTPVVFISYSWDGIEHDKWILKLAGFLRDNGVDVILDKYELKAGRNLIHFMEQSIKKADKIVVIFTPNYKLKAENRNGGVGYEYSIMNAALYKNQTGNEKIIPMLRNGTQEESIPEFMQQFIHLDFRNDDTFETSCTDLLREIFNEPAIKKPKLGKRPSFD
jgi:hypothetical protein